MPPYSVGGTRRPVRKVARSRGSSPRWPAAGQGEVYSEAQERRTGRGRRTGLEVAPAEGPPPAAYRRSDKLAALRHGVLREFAELTTAAWSFAAEPTVSRLRRAAADRGRTGRGRQHLLVGRLLSRRAEDPATLVDVCCALFSAVRERVARARRLWIRTSPDFRGVVYRSPSDREARARPPVDEFRHPQRLIGSARRPGDGCGAADREGRRRRGP